MIDPSPRGFSHRGTAVWILGAIAGIFVCLLFAVRLIIDEIAASKKKD